MMASPGSRTTLVFALACAAGLSGCGGDGSRGAWTFANGNLAGTRAADGSPITAANVGRLRVRWRFPLRAKPGASGIFASTPVADANTIYLQDLDSDVFALNRATGAVRWSHRYDARNDGPNGLAVRSGRVYGETDDTVFALASENGRELWQRHMTNAREPFVGTAPIVWDGLVFISTIGYAPSGRGTIYALDASTGKIRWRFNTGGIWYAGSIDAAGRLYTGTVPYTNSLLVLDAKTGKFLWTDRATARETRDRDLAATPILGTFGDTVVVFGAYNAGRVVAWDGATKKRRWTRAVGTHCPGLAGVEAPMAYAHRRLFVPIIDRCGSGSATSRFVAIDAKTGTTLWGRRLPSPALGCATVANDVVFTATFAGVVYAFSTKHGKLLWHAAMPAGVNACPAVVGDLLVVGAGIRHPGRVRPEIAAFGLPRR
jgi:outer membrane protein assembly factor BamB